MLAMSPYSLLCAEARASAMVQAAIRRALEMREYIHRKARDGAAAAVLQALTRRMLAVASYSEMRGASNAATCVQSAIRRALALQLYIEGRARVEAARAARRRRLLEEGARLAARLQPVMGLYSSATTRSRCTTFPKRRGFNVGGRGASGCA